MVNCSGLDTGLFFDDARAEEAKTICNGCPQRLACLDQALLTEDFGVWGGTTAEERQAIREARGIELETNQAATHPKCGTNAGYYRLIAQRLKGFKVEDCEPCRLAHNRYAIEKKAQRNAK